MEYAVPSIKVLYGRELLQNAEPKCPRYLHSSDTLYRALKSLLIRSIFLLTDVGKYSVLKHVQWPVTRLLQDPISLLDLSKCIITYLLAPWSIIRLEKLTGSQLVKKFPPLYGTRRFITAFTSARHQSLS